MTRTSPAPMTSETVVGGTTILPGVPLPSWLRPDEPIAPEPDPAPAPARVSASSAGAAVVTVGEPEAPASDESFLLEAAASSAPYPTSPSSSQPSAADLPVLTPPAPESVAVETVTAETVTAQPVADAVDAAVDEPPTEGGRRGRHGHRFRRGGAAASATVAAEAVVADGEDAVPQLAPPTPVPPRAELYAAAGAAPPTAPWGTPPAGGPVDRLPPTTEPVELAAVASDLAPEDVDHDDERGSSRGSQRSLVVLGALGAVLVVGAVAAFVWPGLLVAEDTSTAASPRPAVSVASTVTLAAPATVDGMTQLTGAPADALAKAAAAAVLTGYDAPVSAVYGTGTTPGATVLAWKATKPGSPADVVTAFGGYQGTTGQPVTGIAPVDTGKLGGQMSCGSGVVGATPASVCFWSDDATFGAVTVLKPASATAGAATAVAIRTAMEKKS